MKTRASLLFLGVILTFSTISCQQGGRGTSSSEPMPSASSSSSAKASMNAPILMPVESDPTIALSVWFQVGSHDDPADKRGLAFLTGQMLAQAGTSNNSYEQILDELYPLAASYSIRVDKEMSVLSGRIHRDNVGPYLDLFTDAFLNPGFDQGDFDRIKQDAINNLEKSLRYASDEELGKAALAWSVFDETGYQHPVLGTVSGLKAITLDDVKAFYAKYYTAANARLAVGGGYSARLLSSLQGKLSSLKGSAPANKPAPSPKTKKGRHAFLVQKQDADASISFGFPIDVKRGSRDFYALWLANSWLGEHRNSASHLYQVIREKRGMNYGDYSYIEAFPEGGQRNMPPVNVARSGQMFEIWIRTLPDEDAVFALRAALRELESLIDGGMTQDEFELTRSFLSKYNLHFAPTTSTRLGYAVDDEFYGIDAPGHLKRFRQVMSELTREEVNAAIKKHLQTDDMVIAMVTGSAEKIRGQMTSGEPTPKEYPQPKSDKILAEDKIIAAYPLDISADNVTILPVEQIFE